GVEPLDPVQLLASPRLDDAVGVHDDARAPRHRLAELVVALPGLDPECEPSRLEPANASIREEDARRRMAGARARDLAALAVDGQIDHRDELAGRDLVDDDVVCGR